MCDFMQADSSSETYVGPPKGQERDGWIWRLHGAMNGMRTASRAATEFLVGILTERMGFKRDEMREVSHVDDPLICAKPATLEKIWMQITKLGRDQETRSIEPAHTCGGIGIRVPKCTRSWTQRFHSEADRQVRGRMLGNCSTAEGKGSCDAFDGHKECEPTR